MGPAVPAVLLLLNSAAGNRSGARAADAVRRRWSEDEVVVLDEADPAVRRVRLDQAVVSGVRAVVVHGGDGSLSEAVNVLRGRNVVLGLVPRGSGNDFARGAGLDRGRSPSAVLDLVGAALDWTRSAQDLPEGQERRTPAGEGRHAVGRTDGAEGPRVRPMDAVRLRMRTGTQGADGTTRELLAVNSVNIGIDAEVNARALASRRVPPRWKYLVARCRIVLDVRPALIWVSREGGAPGRRARVLFSVMNGPCVGGGIRLAPSARPDDGTVDVVEVLDASRPTVCAFFPLALVGLHVLHPMVRTSRARRVDLGLPTGSRVYSDGEPVHDGACPACLRIDVLPGAWSLLVP